MTRMHPLPFDDPAGILRAVLSTGAIESMLARCRLASSGETGGVLIGRYSEDLSYLSVAEATGAPADSSSGRNWFERGTADLEALLRQRWEAEPRTHYVGEWHLHDSSNTWPSQQDVRQMKTVACNPDYRCGQPLLVIIGRTPARQWRLRVFLFVAETGLVPLQERAEGAVA